MKLTKPQEQMLADVRAAGPEGKVYNGRARRTIKALEAAGLVNVHWDSIPQTKGGGIELVERITVRPKEVLLELESRLGPNPLPPSGPRIGIVQSSQLGDDWRPSTHLGG